jgi:hypothetical protein
MINRKTNSYTFREFHIPEYMFPALRAYVFDGDVLEDFIEAIICNDLYRACETADDENLKNLPAYVAFFYNETPSDCWGSYEAMLEWKVKKI